MIYLGGKMNTNDPYILLSIINTYLRDKYDNLEELCDKEDIDKEEIITKLSLIEYQYDSASNQFKKL